MQVCNGLHNGTAQRRKVGPSRLAIVFQGGGDVLQPQRTYIARQPLDGMQAFTKPGRVLCPFGLEKQTLGFRSKQRQDFHAKVFIAHGLAIHHGTFSNTDEPIEEPPTRLRAARAANGMDGNSFRALDVGATWALPAMESKRKPTTACAKPPDSC